MDNNLKVFILGSARSGTSILGLGMLSVMKLPGFGESHTIPLFIKMLATGRSYLKQMNDHKVAVSHYVKPRRLDAELVRMAQRLYAATYPSGSWVDKTPGPESIHAMHFIHEAWPEAKIIVTRRNGIEVVNSYLSKFGPHFEGACRGWTSVIVGIQKAKDNRIPLLELDPFDFTNDPQGSAAQIAAYLGRPDCEGEWAAFFRDERVEKTSTHDWTDRLTLSDVPWSKEQKAMFVEICGEQMHRLGYKM